MKRRKFVVASTLVMVAIVGALAVLSLCTSFSAKASTPNFPDALNSIPSDYEFILGINMRQLTASSFYTKLMQEQPQTGQIGKELVQFTEKTGIDPARDISYLMIAARSGEKTKPEGLVILSGDFDRDKITSYIRAKASPTEMAHGGAPVFMIPGQKANGTISGVTFPSEHEIALGDLESLKAVLDTRSGGKKSILSNSVMTSLTALINFDEMFWFAGDAASALKKLPVKTPLGSNVSAIQGIVGSFNVTENVVGKITALAIDFDSATKLADVIRGLIAFGQLSGNRNPDAKLMLDRVTISQNATQVSLSFNIPGDLIKKVGRAKSASMIPGNPAPTSPEAGGTPGQTAPLSKGVSHPIAPGVKAPVVLLQPKPGYTDEARLAKIEGKILIQLMVLKDGTTDSLKVLKGLGYGLDEKAINTIKRQWRFQPGTKNGTPVDMQIMIEVSYCLTGRCQRPQ